jgi:chromosome segregation ATPase
MNARVAIIILAMVCIGLGVGLIARHNQATEEKQQSEGKVLQLSNVVVNTQKELEEQKTVNMTLETNLTARRADLENVSNNLAQTAATLAKTQADAKAAAEVAAAEMAKRDAKITELQGQNDDMTKKMTDLNTSIGSLEQQIADTQNKLNRSEGDRVFLIKELKRMLSEKAELERQFNDLAVLREQVRKLKDELSISRRLEWIRQGIYGRQTQKGGQSLMQNNQPGGGTNIPSTQVELHQSGAVKVLTNTPPVAPAPK